MSFNRTTVLAVFVVILVELCGCSFAAEVCQGYWNSKGTLFRSSFTCPQYCCGTTTDKYCCDDIAKRTPDAKGFQIDTAAWISVFFMLAFSLSMVVLTLYACYLFVWKGAETDRENEALSTPTQSTSCTTLDADDNGRVEYQAYHVNMYPPPPPYADCPPPYQLLRD